MVVRQAAVSECGPRRGRRRASFHSSTLSVTTRRSSQIHPSLKSLTRTLERCSTARVRCGPALAVGGRALRPTCCIGNDLPAETEPVDEPAQAARCPAPIPRTAGGGDRWVLAVAALFPAAGEPAERAWKSARLGFLAFPPLFHLWALWLLRRAWSEGGPRPERGRTLASRALLVSVCAATAFIGLYVRVFLH